MRKIASAFAALPASLSVGCGGGGGGGDPFDVLPLWVVTDVAVADLDGDGRQDILTLSHLLRSKSSGEGHLGVRFQLAGGAFAAADDYLVETYPWRFAVADVDGDGAPDVVVGDSDAQAVTWLRQDPASRGRLLAPIRLLSGTPAGDVAVADLNDDGAADVVAGAGDGVVLLPQDPATPGTFGPAVEVALPGPSGAVATADLNADGLADLAVGYSTPVTSLEIDRTLAILFQQAAGGLSAPQALATRRDFNVSRLRLLDYDGDGTLDVVAYLESRSSSNFSVEVLAVAHPSVGSPSVIETPLNGVTGLNDAAFGDLDGDGRIDVAVADDSGLKLFRQNTDGSLVREGTRSLPIDASRIAVGDVDGDGNLDLVLLGEDDRVLLMLQTTSGIGDFLPPQLLP